MYSLGGHVNQMINGRHIVHFKLHCTFASLSGSSIRWTESSSKPWLKLDGTHVKECLKESVKESVKGVWNGDVDLGDGKLKELRSEYEKRVFNKIPAFGNIEGLQI